MENIYKKIESLGERTRRGKEAPSSQSKKGSNYGKIDFPPSFQAVSQKYGSFDFQNSVRVKSATAIPSCDDNFVEIDGLCSIEDSLILCDTYSDRLPAQRIPINEDLEGDLICLDLENGRVFFWQHDSRPENEFFMIANSFDELVEKMQVFIDEPPSQARVISVKTTDKFLERLRRNGLLPDSDK